MNFTSGKSQRTKINAEIEFRSFKIP